jgi:peptidoglycan hydrolase-like protein with peptidoglycan-binding domain
MRALNLFGWKDLKLFDVGPNVKKASILLANHGSSLKPTEEFTLAMRSAVKAFQKKHDLEQTGVIDKKTWRALKKKHVKC